MKYFTGLKNLKNRTYFILLTIFIITFIGYLVSALQVMPRKDEIEYLWRAQVLVNGDVQISPQHNYFFSVILAIGLFLFGNNLVIAQILSALIGASLVFPSFLLANELFKENIYAPELGLTTAMLVSILLMPYGIEIRNDSLFLFFFLFFCYFMSKSVNDSKYLKFAGVFSGLTYLTRDQGILIIPVMVAYYLLNINFDESKKQNFAIKLKSLLNRNFLLAIFYIVLIIIPKLIWKWLFFGDPFYIRNSNFWLDNYEDKFNTIGFLPTSQYQPSIWGYINSHSLLQMANRWILGAFRMFDKLLIQLLLPVLGLALIGLFYFRTRRDLILHLNLGIWFVVFSWLFGIRDTTRWIIPLFPLLLISATATGMEIIIRILEFVKVKLRSSYSLRINFSVKRILSYLLICFMIIGFLPLFTIRTGQVYGQSVPSQEYQELMDMVDWVSENTAESAVFMTRDGNDLLFYYAHRKAFITPNSDLNFILTTINDLTVNYLIIDSGTLPLRPALADIFNETDIPSGYSLVYWNLNDLQIENDTLEIKIFSTGI